MSEDDGGWQSVTRKSSGKIRAKRGDNAKQREGFVGLLNQGTTCYLNALIQALFMMPEFRSRMNALSREDLNVDNLDKTPEELERLQKRLIESLSRSRQMLSKPPSVKPRRIPIELQRLFTTLQKSRANATSTKDLTESFGWGSSDVFVQQDVSELNRLLFDALERSLVDTPSQSLINDLYRGIEASQTRCLVCNRISSRDQPFLDLSLPVENFPSLESSLDSYLAWEDLSGDNKYYCSNCQGKVDAKRGTTLQSLPVLLTFSLGRFSFDMTTFQRRKVSTRFSFPFELDMTGYLASGLDDSNLPQEQQGAGSLMIIEDKQNAEYTESNWEEGLPIDYVVTEEGDVLVDPDEITEYRKQLASKKSKSTMKLKDEEELGESEVLSLLRMSTRRSSNSIAVGPEDGSDLKKQVSMTSLLDEFFEVFNVKPVSEQDTHKLDEDIGGKKDNFEKNSKNDRKGKQSKSNAYECKYECDSDETDGTSYNSVKNGAGVEAEVKRDNAITSLPPLIRTPSEIQALNEIEKRKALAISLRPYLRPGNADEIRKLDPVLLRQLREKTRLAFELHDQINSSSSHNYVYDLAGVVVHQGTQPERGHYRGFFRDFLNEGRWTFEEAAANSAAILKDLDSYHIEQAQAAASKMAERELNAQSISLADAASLASRGEKAPNSTNALQASKKGKQKVENNEKEPQQPDFKSLTPDEKAKLVPSNEWNWYDETRNHLAISALREAVLELAEVQADGSVGAQLDKIGVEFLNYAGGSWKNLYKDTCGDLLSFLRQYDKIFTLSNGRILALKPEALNPPMDCTQEARFVLRRCVIRGQFLRSDRWMSRDKMKHFLSARDETGDDYELLKEAFETGMDFLNGKYDPALLASAKPNQPSAKKSGGTPHSEVVGNKGKKGKASKESNSTPQAKKPILWPPELLEKKAKFQRDMEERVDPYPGFYHFNDDVVSPVLSHTIELQFGHSDGKQPKECAYMVMYRRRPKSIQVRVDEFLGLRIPEIPDWIKEEEVKLELQRKAKKAHEDFVKHAITLNLTLVSKKSECAPLKRSDMILQGQITPEDKPGVDVDFDEDILSFALEEEEEESENEDEAFRVPTLESLRKLGKKKLLDDKRDDSEDSSIGNILEDNQGYAVALSKADNACDILSSTPLFPKGPALRCQRLEPLLISNKVPLNILYEKISDTIGIKPELIRMHLLMNQKKKLFAMLPYSEAQSTEDAAESLSKQLLPSIDSGYPIDEFKPHEKSTISFTGKGSKKREVITKVQKPPVASASVTWLPAHAPLNVASTDSKDSAYELIIEVLSPCQSKFAPSKNDDIRMWPLAYPLFVQRCSQFPVYVHDFVSELKLPSTSKGGFSAKIEHSEFVIVGISPKTTIRELRNEVIRSFMIMYKIRLPIDGTRLMTSNDRPLYNEGLSAEEVGLKAESRLGIERGLTKRSDDELIIRHNLCSNGVVNKGAPALESIVSKQATVEVVREQIADERGLVASQIRLRRPIVGNHSFFDEALSLSEQKFMPVLDYDTIWIETVDIFSSEVFSATIFTIPPEVDLRYVPYVRDGLYKQYEIVQSFKRRASDSIEVQTETSKEEDSVLDFTESNTHRDPNEEATDLDIIQTEPPRHQVLVNPDAYRKLAANVPLDRSTVTIYHLKCIVFAMMLHQKTLSSPPRVDFKAEDLALAASVKSFLYNFVYSSHQSGQNNNNSVTDVTLENLISSLKSTFVEANSNDTGIAVQPYLLPATPHHIRIWTLRANDGLGRILRSDFATLEDLKLEPTSRFVAEILLAPDTFDIEQEQVGSLRSILVSKRIVSGAPPPKFFISNQDHFAYDDLKMASIESDNFEQKLQPDDGSANLAGDCVIGKLIPLKNRKKNEATLSSYPLIPHEIASQIVNDVMEKGFSRAKGSNSDESSFDSAMKWIGNSLAALSLSSSLNGFSGSATGCISSSSLIAVLRSWCKECYRAVASGSDERESVLPYRVSLLSLLIALGETSSSTLEADKDTSPEDKEFDEDSLDALSMGIFSLHGGIYVPSTDELTSPAFRFTSEVHRLWFKQDSFTNYSSLKKFLRDNYFLDSCTSTLQVRRYNPDLSSWVSLDDVFERKSVSKSTKKKQSTKRTDEFKLEVDSWNDSTLLCIKDIRMEPKFQALFENAKFEKEKAEELLSDPDLDKKKRQKIEISNSHNVSKALALIPKPSTFPLGVDNFDLALDEYTKAISRVSKRTEKALKAEVASSKSKASGKKRNPEQAMSIHVDI